MAKKTWHKKLNAPIKPLRLDNTEFLLLLVVTISLMVFFAVQQGWLSLSTTSVLGIATSR